eukprot:2862426-Amphidinium_carterae.2
MPRDSSVEQRKTLAARALGADPSWIQVIHVADDGDITLRDACSCHKLCPHRARALDRVARRLPLTKCRRDLVRSHFGSSHFWLLLRPEL